MHLRCQQLLRRGEAPTALGEPLAINPVIDPHTRTIEVRFALDNRDARLQIGQALRLRLFIGREESAPAIPESAIVDDGGRPVVQRARACDRPFLA